MLKPTYPCFQTLLFTTYLVSSHIAAFVDIIRGEYRFWLDIIDLDSKQLNQKIGLKSKSENIFSAAHCKYLLIIHCSALMRNETLQSAPHDIPIAKPKNWLQFCSWVLVYCCDKVYRLLSNYCNHDGIPVFLFEKNSDSYAAMKE